MVVDLPHHVTVQATNVCAEADKSPAIVRADTKEHVACQHYADLCTNRSAEVSFQTSMLLLEHKDALQSRDDSMG